MLRFVTGPVHSGRDEKFSQLIKSACESDSDVLVIVPDQFSFEYDKKLYQLLGAKAFNRIKTAGFNRLAELISRSCGAGSRENANVNAKIITMYKAVRRLKETKDVRYYKRALDKGSFIGQVISLVSELIQSGVSPEMLRAAAEKMDGTAAGKLFDLARLYAFYLEELSAAGLKDSLTSLGECVKLVKDSGYFKGMHIFIDAFSGFSMDEYRLIGVMLRQASQVTVSLVLSEENNGRSSRTPFAETIRTRENLRRIAMDCNSQIEETAAEELFGCRSEILHINRNIYSSNHEKLGSSEGVKLITANEIYEESEYICAEIMRLVREDGYRFGEIAVAARDIGQCAAVLEGTFERYEIPYFIDSRRGAEQSALVIYLKSIFEAVLTREYRTENILRCIKSPLCAIYDFDVLDLESYCIKWNVNGDMWLHEFTAGEKGKKPERIDATRRRIIEPFERFKSASENATAGEICRALYALLEDIQLSQQVYSVVKRAGGSSNDTELELGRTSKQLWQTVLGAVQAIYENMTDEKISLRRFYELFKLMVAQMTVSSPPQKIDSVRCAGAERSRLTNVRALFVLEVNDGIFPAEAKSEGLLSERERRLLEEENISLSGNLMNMIEDERLVAYQTFSMPTERLYVMTSESDLQGSTKKPSQLFNMLANMYAEPDCIKVQDIEPEFFCATYRSAYYKYLERSKESKIFIKHGDDAADKRAEDRSRRKRADEIASIKTALQSSELYAAKISSCENRHEAGAHKLSTASAKELFFSSGSMNLSATRVGDYYKCPFLFFCRYGLKLDAPQAVKLDQMNRGNIMHRCLEMVMSKDGSGRRIYDAAFEKLSDGELKSRIHKQFEDYYYNELGGDFGKNKRFLQQLSRYEQTAFYIVKIIQQELAGSGFKPEAFEFDLSKNGGESILKLDLGGGCVISLYGKIDRADVFTDENGRRFLRIVDYKTGSTKFSLDEIYSGLNMQMLIYLFALTQSENELNPDGSLIPAGIMYSHIKEFLADGDPVDTDEDKLFEKRVKSTKPDGLMTANDNAIGALNKAYKGAFTMFTLKKDGSFAANGAQPVAEMYLDGLEKFVKQKVEALAKKLMNGMIEASPVQIGEGMSAKLPCTYCDYYSICGNASPRSPRLVKKGDAERLNAEIEKLNSQGKEESADE